MAAPVDGVKKVALVGSGNWYVRVHAGIHVEGEREGDIPKQPTPGYIIHSGTQGRENDNLVCQLQYLYNVYQFLVPLPLLQCQ